ncbi:hypothetical protein [Albidovulum sp.]
MTVSEELVNRLSSETGRRLAERARLGRRRALQHISACCVTVTTDGEHTWEEYFDKTPTLSEIVKRVGGDVFIVSLGMKRKPLRQRLRLAFAAE